MNQQSRAEYSFEVNPGQEVGMISGYRDYNEGEATLVQYWRRRLEGIYQKYGFSPVENRPVERVCNLLHKGGIDKEIFGLCRAENGEQVEVGLPFDRTVPLALWVAQFKGDIAFPFKRYDIAYSFRGEQAVANSNRFRGFIQSDVDIIDYNRGNRVQADAECLATTIQALESLKIPPFVMHMNHIRIARAIIKEAAIPAEKVQYVLGQLDKLDKKSKEEVIVLLQEQVTELNSEQISKLIDKFEFKGNIEAFVPGADWGEEAKGALKELKDLFAMSYVLGVKKEQLIFNLRIVRGLDYYTGVIAETFFSDKNLSKYGSIASGGRYDHLVDTFEGKKTGLQGVGVSIGLTRLFGILSNEKLLDTNRRGNSDVLVGFRTNAQMLKAVEVANLLRERGFNVDLYSGDKRIKGQLAYADKKRIPYSLLVMDEESSFVVKDMHEQKGENKRKDRGKDFASAKEAMEYLLNQSVKAKRVSTKSFH